MEVDRSDFNRWHNKAKSNKTYSGKESKDFALVKDGVTVWFHNTDFKTKIKLLVNPSRVLDLDDLTHLWKPKQKNVVTFLLKLDEHIKCYFNDEYEIEDFKLTRIDFTKNVYLGDAEKVSAYIKVLYNIRKVKGFSPKNWSHIPDFNEDHSFDLEGNSNGIEFTAYDKAAAIKKGMESNEYKRKKLKERLIKAKGILRLEVKLTTQKAIRKYTNEDNTVKRILDLCGRSREIFLETFVRVVPFGDLHKKDAAVKIIHENVTDSFLKRKMLALLELIPKKKSLYLAIKELNNRNIDRILAEFYKHNLSPVTISKRHNASHLKSLYTFFDPE